MTDEAFKTLLEKYEKGLCTPKEIDQLYRFLDNFQEDAGLDKPLTEEEKTTGQEMFTRIMGSLPVAKPKHIWAKPQWYFLPLAASIIGWICLLAFKGILPSIDTFFKGEMAHQIIVETQDNEHKEVYLSDGSIILMNHNSTIKYPRVFPAAGRRAVELEGEAFFIVAKDPKRPFVVQTQDIETLVLGTSFNIDSRPESDKIGVALVEGKVDVMALESLKKDILEPNEQWLYSKSDKTTRKTLFKGNLIYAWKEDVLQFDQAMVEEVVEALEKKYSVTMKIERPEAIESLLVYRVDTKKYSLWQVLNHIAKVTDYKFSKQKDGSILVQPK